MILLSRTILQNCNAYHNKVYIVDIWQNPAVFEGGILVKVHWGGINASSFITQTKDYYVNTAQGRVAAKQLKNDIIHAKTRASGGYEVTTRVPKNLYSYLTSKNYPIEVSKVEIAKKEKAGFASFSKKAEAATQQLNKPILRKIRL
jgi:hypothetical protein